MLLCSLPFWPGTLLATTSVNGWTAAMSNRQQYKKKRQSLYFCRLYRFLSEFPSKNLYIEQSCDLTALVYVDLGCCRYFRKSWHGHDLTGQCNNKSCTCGNLKISYCYLKYNGGVAKEDLNNENLEALEKGIA